MAPLRYVICCDVKFSYYRPSGSMLNQRYCIVVHG